MSDDLSRRYPGDPRPWAPLASELAGRIRGGRYEPGFRLPKAGQLAREMGFAALLGKPACDSLQEAGLVEEHDGWYYVGEVPGEERKPPRPRPVTGWHDAATQWKRVRREILHEITAGVLEPGDELISLHEAQDRGTSHGTVLKALRSLAEDGLVVKTGDTHNSPYVVAQGIPASRATGPQSGNRAP